MSEKVNCSSCGTKMNIGGTFGTTPRAMKCAKCGLPYCRSCCGAGGFSNTGKCPRCGGKVKKWQEFIDRKMVSS